MFLTQRLLWPLTGLAEVADMYQRSMSSIDRAMDLLDTPINIPYEDQHFPINTVKGELRFEHVGFAYGTAPNSTPTLQDINITIPAGKTTAFVGSTGSGKSTLVKLLLRFYTAQSGRILVDGQSIDGLNLQDLRRAVGYVSQDTFLTDGTVAENIAYGAAGAIDAQIAEAARAAECTEFINQLPLGFATRIGERGQKLSGGQRLSTVRQADCIHLLEARRIVESGTHDALVAQGGGYAALWRLQTGERG